MDRDYQGGGYGGGGYDGPQRRPYGRSQSAHEEYYALLPLQIHQFQSLATDRDWRLLTRSKDPSLIIPLRWYNGCDTGDLSTKVDHAWSGKDPVRAT